MSPVALPEPAPKRWPNNTPKQPQEKMIRTTRRRDRREVPAIFIRVPRLGRGMLRITTVGNFQQYSTSYKANLSQKRPGYHCAYYIAALPARLPARRAATYRNRCLWVWVWFSRPENFFRPKKCS